MDLPPHPILRSQYNLTLGGGRDLATSPEAVFGAAQWTHIQSLATSGYLPALQDLAKNLTAPYWWRNAELGILQGGTVCFVDTGTRVLGISAAHIHDEVATRRSQDASFHCQVGGHTFEPVARLVDIDRDLDVVTYAFSEVSVNAARANINTPTAWPPPVTDGDTVLACGWPWELDTPGDTSHDFEFLHFIARVEKNTPDQLGIATFTSTSVPWGDRALPKGTNLGGMSGGPIFRLIEYPFSRLELVGIIHDYQPSYELIRARPLSVVRADGSISQP